MPGTPDMPPWGRMGQALGSHSAVPQGGLSGRALGAPKVFFFFCKERMGALNGDVAKMTNSSHPTDTEKVRGRPCAGSLDTRGHFASPESLDDSINTNNRTRGN